MIINDCFEVVSWLIAGVNLILYAWRVCRLFDVKKKGLF